MLMSQFQEDRKKKRQRKKLKTIVISDLYFIRLVLTKDKKKGKENYI